MTDTFLTVKEASELTGKSISSIRRLLQPLLRDPQHPQRSHLQPSVEEALQMRVKGENFLWRISREWLLQITPAAPAASKKTVDAGRENKDAAPELIAMLREELAVKNQQIIQQSELISKQLGLFGDLAERLREGNVLIASLQHRLALSDGRTEKSTIVEPNDATLPKSAKIEKDSPLSSKPAKPKRGIFATLFR